MSGLAVMMSALGYEVTGSDLTASAVTADLLARGVEVQTGHDARWVGHADVVVTSAAIREENPEVQEARRRRLPVLRRGVMLAGLSRSRSTVAVTGTHGKSTTSSMVAVMLTECGFDPSALIGARVGAFGSNARVGQGRHFVVEADESERSLLELTPDVAVLTNLEEEHLDYYGTVDALRNTIVDFANRVTPSGVVVLCADDPELARLRNRIDGRVVTYGLEAPEADVVGDTVVCGPTGSHCLVRDTRRRDTQPTPLTVGVPGRHNLLNALGAFSVGLETGLGPSRVASALATYAGIDRRFQLQGDVGGVRVVDDYAHHPTEIAAVLATARDQGRQRLIVVFQPHRFSRTSRLLHQFARALGAADLVVLLDIFPAGESPIPGVTAEHLAQAVRTENANPVHCVPAIDEAIPLLLNIARPGDLVVTLGAGSIGALGKRLVSALRHPGPAATEAGGSETA
jgi:UDP-N-acetylmuramate--alanine ligase